MPIDYHFGSTGGGDVAGFNDPVAANFSYEGNLTDILIREAIQNIIDAKLLGKQPVRAEFDLKFVPVKELPNSKRLEEIFRKCAAYADKRKTVPAAKHYRAQADVISESQKIPLLCISDYNTCGLTGDHEDGRWFMFMRGVGINAGEAGAGGAFGLGKGAFFANSLFRTIFVSTLADDGAKFAGKSRLISFEEDRQLMQGNGTFGLTGQLPVRNQKDIPKLFKRTQKGTDIWIVNYLDSQDWENAICRAVLGWFWPAIHWKTLSVKVGDREINSGNLRERMTEFYSPLEKIPNKPFNPLHFFDSYVDSEKKTLDGSLDNLKEVSFYGRTSDELPFPNKTALIRNTGMVIDFAPRASHLTKYAAVFECRNKEGSAILRKLENPSHTDWDWHNWKDEHGRYVEEGRIAQKELDYFITEALDKLLYVSANQSTIIPGLTDYLGAPTTDSTSLPNGAANNLVREPVDEETGIEIGSDDREDVDNFSSNHTIKPIRVARYVPVKKPVKPEMPLPPPDTKPFVPVVPPLVDPAGKALALQELENAVVRYVVGEQTTNGRIYRFIIHADNIEKSVAVRMSLIARAEEGEGELLDIASIVGERGTKVIKADKEYCDFFLDDSGKAYLSVELKEPWIVAFDPNLRIKL